MRYEYVNDQGRCLMVDRNHDNRVVAEVFSKYDGFSNTDRDAFLVALNHLAEIGQYRSDYRDRLLDEFDRLRAAADHPSDVRLDDYEFNVDRYPHPAPEKIELVKRGDR